MTSEESKQIETTDNYSIYKYFRNKPTALVTVITAIVSFTSILINIVIVNLRLRYNSYWGFEVSSIRYSATSNASFFFALVLCCIVVNFINYYIATTFEVFFKNLEHYSPIFKETKIIQKQLRELKKRCKEEKYKTHVLDEKTFEYYVHEIKSIEGNNKERKRNVLKIEFYIFGEFCKSILPALLFLVIVFGVVFVFLPTYVDSIVFLFEALKLIGIWIASALFLNVILVFVRKKKAKKTDDEDDESFSKKAQELVKSFPLTKIRNYKFKDFLSNSNIGMALSVCSLFLVILGLGLSIYVGQAIIDNKTFFILQYEDMPVAVIFSDESFLYCDKAQISGETINISKAEHVIIPKENATYYEHQFSSVVRMESPLDGYNEEEEFL